MNHKPYRIAFALMIVAALSVAAFAAGNEPQVSLKSISVKSFSLSSGAADLMVYLDVENTSGAEITLKDVSYKLKLNGQDAGHGKQEKDIKLPARSKTTVEMPLTVDLTALPGITWSALTSGFKLHYDLDAEFSVPVLAIFTHKVKTSFNGDFTIDDAASSVSSFFKGIFGGKP